MTIEAIEPGLRERKRIATRRNIQAAAVDLVFELGLENVTIDEISKRADISPRTFFNYFASKEEALIGDGPPLPDDAAISEFVASDSDIFLGIGELIAGAGDKSNHDVALSIRRREMMKGHPHLFAIRMATMRHFEQELTAIVAQRVARGEPGLEADSAQKKAALITIMAGAAMKHAWTCWAEDHDGIELSVRLRESFADMRAVLASTVVR